MEQIGKIEKIENNIAIISVKRVSSCGDNCAHCKSSCGEKTVKISAEINNEFNLQEGDFVEIKSENNVLLKHMIMMFIMPLCLMLCVIFITNFILKNSNKDLISIICGILSLFVSFFILKWYDKKEMKKNSLKFVVVKKI